MRGVACRLDEFGNVSQPSKVVSFPEPDIFKNQYFVEAWDGPLSEFSQELAKSHLHIDDITSYS
jgi:hypothetical protein